MMLNVYSAIFSYSIASINFRHGEMLSCSNFAFADLALSRGA